MLIRRIDFLVEGVSEGNGVQTGFDEVPRAKDFLRPRVRIFLEEEGGLRRALEAEQAVRVLCTKVVRKVAMDAIQAASVRPGPLYNLISVVFNAPPCTLR